MAITINQYPYYGSNKIIPANQKLIYVCTSTEVSGVNFKYLVEVDDGDGTQIAKFLIAPNPANKLIFDLHDVTRSRVFSDPAEYIDPTADIHHLGELSGIFSKATNGCKKFTVNFGESYDVSGVITEFPDSATNSVYLFDYKYQYADGFRPDPQSYYTMIGGTTLTQMPLSDFPSSYISSTGYKVQDGDYMTLGFIEDNGTLLTGNDATKIEYKIYNDSTLIGTDTIDINVANGAADTSGVNEEDKLIYFGCGPGNLSTFQSTINPLYWPSFVTWTHYTLRFQNASNNYGTTLMKFVKQEPDCNYDTVRLAWWNSKGAWDYFNFIKFSQEEIAVQRKRYSKLIGDYGGSTFDFNSFDRGDTEYQSTVDQFMVINSDWMDDAEFTALRSLFYSNDVRIVTATGSIPVVVEDTSYITRQNRPTMIYNQTIRLKIAQPFVG